MATQNGESITADVQSKSDDKSGVETVQDGVSSDPLTKSNAAEDQAGDELQKLPVGPVRTDTTTALAQALSPPEPPTNINTTSTPISKTISSAIGPSSDQLAAVPSKEEGELGPQLQFTLLLTDGARHPFKLDTKYLAKRNVEVQDDDPFNLSVYKLKELILREWREEWETKPTNPSYIRLISFGRMLDDKTALKDNRFNAEQSNVLHMTIKPQEFAEEDEGKGGKSAYSHHNDGPERRSPGCRCVIM